MRRRHVSGLNPGDEYPATLQTVVAASRRRIINLIDELSHHTTTPGVDRDLETQLVHDLDRYLAAIERIAYHEAARRFGPRDVDLVLAGNIDLRRQIGVLAHSRPAPRAKLERLRVALARHIAAEDDLLARLHDETGDKHMVKLGFDLAEVTDRSVRHEPSRLAPAPIRPRRSA